MVLSCRFFLTFPRFIPLPLEVDLVSPTAASHSIHPDWMPACLPHKLHWNPAGKEITSTHLKRVAKTEKDRSTDRGRGGIFKRLNSTVGFLLHN